MKWTINSGKIFEIAGCSPNSIPEMLSISKHPPMYARHVQPIALTVK